MGFARRDFLNIKLNHGSKLIIVDREGYALISGLSLGPLISKNINTAVDLIRVGISLGAKHSKFSYNLSNFIKLTERGDEANLKMFYGKKILQKLEYFYALGTYAKG